jgi:hypothetical protein
MPCALGRLRPFIIFYIQSFYCGFLPKRAFPEGYLYFLSSEFFSLADRSISSHLQPYGGWG